MPIPVPVQPGSSQENEAGLSALVTCLERAALGPAAADDECALFHRGPLGPRLEFNVFMATPK